MCGRVRCSLSREEVRAETNIARWRDEDRYQQSWNSHPGRSSPVIKQNEQDGQLELHTMKWGLVPSYTKKGEKPDFFRMFNARSETVAEKGVFKKLLSRQRCVVPVNGFYEWKKEGKQKQPYFIFQEGHTTMRMAGLFDVWHSAEDEPMYSFTILTTESSEKLQWLHDRMPVILPDKAAEDLWLIGEGDEPIQKLGQLCTPYNKEDLQWFAVEPFMSNMKNDGPECCQPLRRKAITSFFKPKLEMPVMKEDPHQPGKSKLPAEQQEAGDNFRAPDGAQVAAEDEIRQHAESAGQLSKEDADRSTSTLQGDSVTDAHSLRNVGGSTPDKKKRPAAAASPASGSKKAKLSPAVPKKGRITSFFMKNSA